MSPFSIFAIVIPTPPVVGGGGGMNITIPYNKTFCGDGVCQREGNDFGMKEDWANCAQDCPAFDFDALIFALTSNCFDRDPSTYCFWGDLFRIIGETFAIFGDGGVDCGDGICQPNENFINCKGDCGNFDLSTLYNNCFDDDEKTPCFWAQNLSYYMLLLGFIILLVLSMIKIKFKGKEKKVSIIGYIGGKFKRR